MDMMEVRRRLLMEMAAKGADYVSGTFTTPLSGSTYTLNFGKSYRRYMYLIEMTDDSKTTLLSSGQTAARMYACVGIYPMPEIDSKAEANSYLSSRIVPSSSTASAAVSTSGSATESGVTLTLGVITSGANILYRGYTYKYTVVSLDNI